MLISFNLTSRVDFPTRIQNKSSTIIDNIFINILHVSKSHITPLANGLSDNSQHLTTSEINLTKQACHNKNFRNINENSIIEFQIKLSYELWDNDINSDNGNNFDILFLFSTRILEYFI